MASVSGCLCYRKVVGMASLLVLTYLEVRYDEVAEIGGRSEVEPGMTKETTLTRYSKRMVGEGEGECGKA